MYNIAIVDDNESWCYVLALRLQQQGYAVSTFTNGYKFLQHASLFDLVLVDFSIPTPAYQIAMDGPEIICKAKQILEKPPLLVLISGYFTKDLLSHAAHSCPEADSIISKQTDISEIISEVERLLRHRPTRNQNRQLSKQASEVESFKSQSFSTSQMQGS
ncbi:MULTISPECIES: response regulator [unclassified Leptolyngbya]|uniref:response regulator n=1 Tax=unclassified Leptolyngbya TaxID=2650499 RepID=UPI0016856D37|nr:MULTISPECIES: response regulator [unclassified Leptolyngbya]MBD1913095.1 response regulator [Leptolyngbya sp. FACHB-8]MBD2155560.1 response regulator [Leptolyngbya sp. FACHB-16]